MPATVLVVDDEIHMRRLAARILELAGYTVLEASSGDEALSIVEKTPPDVITCDISMPGMSGFEFLAAIKAVPAGAKIPVIMLTALGQNKDISRATALGAAAYISKPFSSAKLIETIQHQLDVHK
jgi:CheY-like chemotaxis protein